MASEPSEILELLQQVDRSAAVQLTSDDVWTALLARADAVLADVVELVGAPLDRYLPQDAEFFIQFTKWTPSGVDGDDDAPRSVFSLAFSFWGDLVCITHDAEIASEDDLAALAQFPQILERHGFVPVTYEQLQSPYTDESTWHWRFFDWH